MIVAIEVSQEQGLMRWAEENISTCAELQSPGEATAALLGLYKRAAEKERAALFATLSARLTVKRFLCKCSGSEAAG